MRFVIIALLSLSMINCFAGKKERLEAKDEQLNCKENPKSKQCKKIKRSY